MKILIAPDAFKDCLSARKVALALGEGIKSVLPDTDMQIAPMADGGEGTVESVIDATGGKMISIKVMDPLMREISSFYGVTGDGRTAVIEMAAASGIELLTPGERDPWVTSTYGTGQLIRDALDQGCRRILLGIGGSATNDAGAGMAQALGIRFSSMEGPFTVRGGGSLGEVVSIQMDDLDSRIGDSEILVACDVTNPLTGPTGASNVYGPQKGGSPEIVKKLDHHLEHFAGIIREQTGKEVAEVPGAGAAGGLGAGLMAFLNARLMKGFEMIAETVMLEEKIKNADLVITGEGKMDGQTRYGKTPYGVAQCSKQYGKPVIGVAGSVEGGSEVMYQMGFDLILPILESPSSLDDAIDHAEELLKKTGERIARIINLRL